MFTESLRFPTSDSDWSYGSESSQLSSTSAFDKAEIEKTLSTCVPVTHKCNTLAAVMHEVQHEATKQGNNISVLVTAMPVLKLCRATIPTRATAAVLHLVELFSKV